MSLRDKAREIKVAGEAKRGDFTPHGKPLENYKYWATHTLSDVPEKENWCRYWRVVTIWYPLMRLGEKLGNKGVLAVVIVLYSLLALWLLTTNPVGQVIGFSMFVIPWAIAGVGSNLAVLSEEIYEGVGKPKRGWLYAGMAIGLPITIVMQAVYGLVRYFPKSVGRFIENSIGYIFGGALAILAVFFLGLGVVNVGWIFFVYLVVGVALFCGFVFGLVALATWIEGWRQVKKEKRQEGREALALEDEPVIKGPGIFKRFFTAFGDFVVLLGQVVRVSKWKICPIAEIPTERV